MVLAKTMLINFRILLFLFISLTTAAQEIRLMKSTMSASATASSRLTSGTISINHTIGQSSSIKHFNTGHLHLLQGFQHPFVFGCGKCNVLPVVISIYPNPSQGIISIRWQNDIADDFVWMDVIDIHGKIVVKILLQRKGQELEFDASALPKATYVLQLRGTKGDYATHKFILI